MAGRDFHPRGCFGGFIVSLDPQLIDLSSPGFAWRTELLIRLEQGFEDDDWYYDIGVYATEFGDQMDVGKRPALIVGFNQYGTVERVYQLRIH